MRLTNLADPDWQKNGYVLPKYDKDKVRKETIENPMWIHFGGGNIFRAFPCVILQKLLDEGSCNKGLILCESFDTEIIDKVYTPYDNNSLQVTLKSDGTIEKTVVSSVVQSYKLDGNVNEIKKAFENESLEMISFTITEKGYALKNQNDEYLDIVKQDFCNPPENAKHLMSIITQLLLSRYLKGEYKLAVVSMDNCSNNGDKLKESIVTIAKEWLVRGYVNEGFLGYLQNESKVSFPVTVIDKITPRPDVRVKEMLEKDGFCDTEIIITNKNTYTAPFTNAEEVEYLIIDDKFPNGRPSLENAGVMFATRDVVEKFEKMKVCTCLNPLHTALAIFGCLLGYELIFDEMQDETLYKLVKKLGYDEGMKVVVNPEIIDPTVFLDTVIEKRLKNPFMPDSPKRIATDTSQKLGIRFGETVKSYIEKGLDLNSLDGISLVIAGYLRYLMGVDDNLNIMVLSPDPLIDMLQLSVKDEVIGDTINNKLLLIELLRNKNVFGVDYVEVGMSDKILCMFTEMKQGEGAVRCTLEKYLI